MPASVAQAFGQSDHSQTLRNRPRYSGAFRKYHAQMRSIRARAFSDLVESSEKAGEIEGQPSLTPQKSAGYATRVGLPPAASAPCGFPISLANPGQHIPAVNRGWR